MRLFMRNRLTSLLGLFLAAGSLASCRESSKLPAPAIESVPLVIPEVNTQKNYFDFVRSRASVNSAASTGIVRPVFEFVVNPSQGYTELNTVEVYKSYRRGTVLGPRVKVTDLTSFPATVSINSQDVITDLYLASPTADNPTPAPLKAPAASPAQNNRVLTGDAIVFTFEYVLKDGRRIVLTPLSTTTGSVGAPTGTQINTPYAAVALFR